MEPGSSDGRALPRDILIVEDDPIIALDFEDRNPRLRGHDSAHSEQYRACAGYDRRARRTLRCSMSA